MRRRKRKLSVVRLAVAAGIGAVLGPVVIPKLEQRVLALKDGLKPGHSDRKRDKGQTGSFHKEGA